MKNQKEILQKHTKSLLEKKNVVAVGIGLKTTKGIRMTTLVIICSVEKKVPLSELKKRDVIPSEVNGVATDVVQTGAFKALKARTDRWRPAPGGVSVGHEKISAGTLGAIVKKNGAIHILSNNHILANCLDEKAEVLTKNGFRYFKDLNGNELLATLNVETNYLEYQRPDSLQKQFYEGFMVHLKSRSIDMLITPNHRILAKRVYKSGFPKHLPKRSLGFFKAMQVVDDMNQKKFLTTPHALMRGIPHPHGLGFLLRSQSQRPDSTGLTSHLSDGTVLQIQKPVTNNSLINKMKNIKRNKCLTSPLLKQGALRHGTVSYELPSKSNWNCASPSSINIPGVFYRAKNHNLKNPMPIDSWLELFGIYIADGCAIENSANGQKFISIRNMSKKKRERITRLAKECGFNPWDCPSGAVVINSKQLYEHLKPLGGSKEKFVPESIKDLSPGKLRIFLKGYISGDGCLDKAGQWVLITASKQLADDLQEMMLKCGLSFTSSIKRGSPYNPEGIYYFIRTKKRASLRLQETPKLIPYNGMIYCASVPNSTLFVRRNGKTAWTGNSNDASKGDAILQPGPTDGGRYPIDRIATLSDFVRIQWAGGEGCKIGQALARCANSVARLFGRKTMLEAVTEAPENLVDAAIAKLIKDSYVSDELLELGKIKGSNLSPVIGMAVRKSGRTTAVTGGEIVQTDVVVQVGYGNGKKALFIDQLMVEPGDFSAPGDSGSVVIDSDNNIIGLLFAGSDTSTIVNRIGHVFSLLEINL